MLHWRIMFKHSGNGGVNSRPARLVTKQFYTTQMSNLKTQKLLIVLRGIELFFWRKKTFFLCFYFLVFQSQFCCSDFPQILHTFDLDFDCIASKGGERKLKMIFTVFVLLAAPFFPKLRAAHAHRCGSSLCNCRKVSFHRAACSFNTSFFNVMNIAQRSLFIWDRKNFCELLKLTIAFYRQSSFFGRFIIFAASPGLNQMTPAKFRAFFSFWVGNFSFRYVRACIGVTSCEIALFFLWKS